MSAETVFIVLFRGVGGKTQLPTKPLREKLAKVGFRNVVTYINSGNAVVKSELPRKAVALAIAEVCAREFGFDKAVYALTRAEWSRLIAGNPFRSATDTPTFLHMAVLAARPEKANVDALQALAAKGEGFAVIDKAAYLHTPGGFSKSKLAEKIRQGHRRAQHRAQLEHGSTSRRAGERRGASIGPGFIVLSRERPQHVIMRCDVRAQGAPVASFAISPEGNTDAAQGRHVRSYHRPAHRRSRDGQASVFGYLGQSRGVQARHRAARPAALLRARDRRSRQ
jgi:uncharacterized protein (DUF1697 family)